MGRHDHLPIDALVGIHVLIVDVAAASEGLRLGQPVERGRTPLPAIAITAHGETHGPDRTLPAGFSAHIRKPIDHWELCRLVASLARRDAAR